MHPPDAAISAVRLSQHLEAAQHLLKRPSLPSSRLLCLPLTCNRLCREAAPRHACSRTPLLRVNRADTAAVAALPRACSDCALRRRDAALLIRHDIQIHYSNAAFTSTVVLAGPRPAAESAHNMTLQLNCVSVCLGLPGRRSSKLNHRTANQPTARRHSPRQ